MDHFEMVEKLRQKTGVTYEEAKAALEVSGWDMLDALLFLEKEQNPADGYPSYSTRPHRQTEEQPQPQSRGFVSRLIEAAGKLIRKCNRTTLVIFRRKKNSIELPVTVLLVLALFYLRYMFFCFVISLFFGVRYRIVGEGESDVINEAMDKIHSFADQVRSGDTKKDGR